MVYATQNDNVSNRTEVGNVRRNAIFSLDSNLLNDHQFFSCERAVIQSEKTEASSHLILLMRLGRFYIYPAHFGRKGVKYTSECKIHVCGV